MELLGDKYVKAVTESMMPTGVITEEYLDGLNRLRLRLGTATDAFFVQIYCCIPCSRPSCKQSDLRPSVLHLSIDIFLLAPASLCLSSSGSDHNRIPLTLTHPSLSFPYPQA
jgi:hypothetical protein